MKKYIALVAFLILAQTGYSQRNVDQLFKEFAKAEHTESVKVGKFMMSLAGLFGDTMGVDGVEVYSFDESPTEVKERLNKAIKGLKDSRFETLVSSNEGNSRVKVLVKIEEEMIREMVVVTTGDSHALVRIKGKIKPSDLQEVADKHGNNGGR